MHKLGFVVLVFFCTQHQIFTARQYVDGSIDESTRIFMSGDTAAFAAYLLSDQDLHRPAPHPLTSDELHSDDHRDGHRLLVPAVVEECLQRACLSSDGQSVKSKHSIGSHILTPLDQKCIDWYAQRLAARGVLNFLACKDRYKEAFKKKCEHDNPEDLRIKYRACTDCLPVKNFVDEVAIGLPALHGDFKERQKLLGLVCDFSHFYLRMKMVCEEEIAAKDDSEVIFWILQKFGLESLSFIAMKKYIFADALPAHRDIESLYLPACILGQLELYKELDVKKT